MTREELSTELSSLIDRISRDPDTLAVKGILCTLMGAMANNADLELFTYIIPFAKQQVAELTAPVS